MDYMISGVTPVEYSELAERFPYSRIREIEERFDDVPGDVPIRSNFLKRVPSLLIEKRENAPVRVPKIETVRLDFKYNPKRCAIGIFVSRNGKFELVPGTRSATQYEQPVVKTLYNYLYGTLEEMRLSSEMWVEV